MPHRAWREVLREFPEISGLLSQGMDGVMPSKHGGVGTLRPTIASLVELLAHFLSALSLER